MSSISSLSSLTSLVAEARRIAVLALPVVGAQVASILLNVVDLLMVGRVGVEPLAAGSLGRLWIWGTLILGMGLIMGIDPLISQAHGARNRHALGLTLQRGIVLALLASIPIAVLWLFTGPVLVAGGQDPELSAQAARYALVQLPGLPAFLVFSALRQYLQGRGIMWPALWVLVVSNVVNVLANWVLIFGHFGFPALGLVGAGIATGSVQILQLVLLVLWIRRFRLHRGAWTGWSRAALDPAALGSILKLAVPVSVQVGLEMWAFQIATLMAGKLGTEELAAHTVVLNLASISFMIPLGISIGTVTRVGNLIGAGRPQQAQVAAWAALLLGAGVMTLSGTAFLMGREVFASWYVDDPTVLALSAAILPIAAAFQLVDGIQVVGGGILRGMGRTRPPAVFNLLGYYALALPLAWWLAFHTSAGLRGVWWGLALGLCIVAIALVAYVAVRGPARAAHDVLATPAGGLRARGTRRD